MQLLMTAAAFERVGKRVAAMAPELEVVTVDPSGAFHGAGGQALESVDPEIVWTSIDSYPGAFPHLLRAIMRGSRAQWMQGFMAGIDNPVFKAILDKGVRLTKSSAQAIPIAEYVVGHAVSLILPIAAQAKAQAAHEWVRTPYREVASTRWVMVGHGNIGREIATRVRAFGAELTVVRANPVAGGEVREVGREALLAELPEADVIVLACPLNAATRHMADDAFFAALKPGAILINIGRGGLVDEAALRRGLDAGRPAHAVLDVFETEPLPADSWLWDHPSVRVSAHCSNDGDGLLARGDALFLDNLHRFLAGQPLLHEAYSSEAG